MKTPYLSLDGGNVEVDYRRGRPKRYPLTEEGCRQAGYDLYKAGIEHWLGSSSLDFPEEYDGPADLDVREVVKHGWFDGWYEVELPKRRMLRKLTRLANKAKFAHDLPADEAEAFAAFLKHVRSLPTKRKE